MFKTIVLACALADVSQCTEYTDTRGPYPTFNQCQARAYEMANAIREVEGRYMTPVKFRCQKLMGTQL